MSDKDQTKKNTRTFSRPKGTRDFYPEELLKRRYITETWRRVALRHGFDEIDGPTFEHLDLYTVKSGEGIVSELFSFQRAGGQETYALRPEFTPTLARMYAARARQLPQPTKWFCIPNFFRAERPQRGRLREFLQWNVDILGSDDAQADFELIEVAIESLRSFGFEIGSLDKPIKYCHRDIPISILQLPSEDRIDAAAALQAIDRFGKVPTETSVNSLLAAGVNQNMAQEFVHRYLNERSPDWNNILNEPEFLGSMGEQIKSFQHLRKKIENSAASAWSEPDISIVRGLAYYTGTVFEVIAEGERAVAGGGRYDNLIDLMGGPPTPAVGFAMGDVVLQNLLEDKGLMPEGRDLLDALDQPVPTRCEAFVIPNGTDEAEEALPRVLSQLRRGERKADAKPWHYTQRPIHARRTYKATRNVGKLLKEADAIGAKYAIILESGEHATVQNLDTRNKHENVPIDEIASKIV